MFEKIFKAVISFPTKNGLLIALGMVILVGLLSMFKSIKEKQQPSILANVVGRSFIRFAEIAGGFVSLVAVIGGFLYLGGITKLDVLVTTIMLIIAFITSILVVIWASDKPDGI